MSIAQWCITAVLSVVMVAGSWLQWLPFSLIETLGFVTGAICVWLVVRQHIWNFPFGITNSVLFLVLFAQNRLYGDAGLQLVYIALGLHGWYCWLHGGRDRGQLQVTRCSRRLLAVIAAVVVLGSFALTVFLQAVRGAAPMLDGVTTSLSLAAQFLLNRKIIENWYLWITADIIYIYLYIVRDLHLTAILYFVFLCMCIAGLVAWRREFGRSVETQHAFS